MSADGETGRGSRGRLVLSWLLVVAGLSCATPLERARLDYQEGRQAFRRGEVMLAYRKLNSAEMKQVDLGREYRRLLEQVGRAAAYLVDKWLARGDFWKEQGNLQRAYQYYADVADSLPPRDPLRRKLLGKARLLGERISYLHKRINDRVAQARELIARQQVEQARSKLLDARQMAIENGLDFPVEYERLIEECNRRSPNPFEVEWAAKVTALSRGKSPPRPRPGREAVPEQRRPHHQQPASSRPRQPEQSWRVDKLLARASQALEGKYYVKAITTLLQVLKLDPDNRQARAYLRALERTRRQLVKEYMKKANAYFAAQQLERAAPYYRKVLQIDPDNLRAREGLEMYRRLRRLKRQERRR